MFMVSLFITGGLFLFGVQTANALIWQGTADYTQGPGATGDEDVVGPFDTYDFGPGAILLGGLGGPLSVGNTFDNYYQSYVDGHSLSGPGAVSPSLNITGAGSGYELTVASNFQTEITSVGFSTSFILTGGTIDLYFDTTPDYSFTGDSGFTNGGAVISGTVVGGAGTTIYGMLGVTSIDFQVNSFNSNVFEPDTIDTGSSVYTLQLWTPADFKFISSVTSVQGHTKGAHDVLMVADGNMSFTAVPEPTSLLLIGTGILGLVALRRQRP